MRLDLLVVKRGLVNSREKAQYAIKKSLIKVDDKIITKPSFDCAEDCKIELLEAPLKYVSKGGLKLEKAANVFNLDFHDKIVLDIGASTGGFTDYCLQNGARMVYALDVGSNQLVDKLRNDSRVKSIEQCNFRDATKETLDNQLFDYVVIDVSFISLQHIFANLKPFITDSTNIIALIKPQFELYEVAYKNKGYVLKVDDHIDTLRRVVLYSHDYGLCLKDLTFSPVRGEKKGNIEFLGFFKMGSVDNLIDYQKIVKEAHKYFGE